MTRTNKTRSALFTSIISLLLCVSMLVGTTFAWFTDTAASGLNEIIAGNLDVALLDNAGNSVEGDTELFTMPELWEPGAVAYAQIQVANVGNLDLKASLSINYEDVNSIDGHVLSEVLKYAIIDASNVDLSSRAAVLKAAKETNNKGALNIYDFGIELQAGEVSDLQTLVIFWEPQGDAVDNLYNVNNGKTTSDGEPLQINLGVKVFATQLGGNNDNESDSFGTDYDENAPTIITVGNDSTVYATIADAYAATGSTSFNVSGPIDMTKLGDLFATANQNVTFNQIKNSAAAYYDFSNTAVNVNGASITINGGYIQGMRSNTGNGFGFQHTTGNITYKGVTINDSWTNENGATVVYDGCTFTGTYYVWTYAVPSATFTGCTFDKEDSRAILVYSHGNNPINATITNCDFKADAKGYTGAPAWTAAVEVDASLISSGATVTISGCKHDTNYNGIVRDKGGKNATITVDGNPLVTNQAAFDAAIAAGKTNIYLAAGTYTLPSMTNMNVTINGGRDAIVDISAQANTWHTQFPGSSITFKGVTVKGATENYRGLNVQSLTYENCAIEGLQFLYAPVVTFTNCEFDSNGAEHCVWTYGAQTVTFNKCDFTYGDRGINCYSDNDVPGGQTVEFTDCTFATTNTASKGAVEINSYFITGGIDVAMNGCTAPAYGEMVYISEWDSTAGAKTDVTVNGSPVNAVIYARNADGLAAALTADKKDITVVLLNNIDVPITSLGSQTPNSGEYKLGGNSTESIVIDLNGKKLNITTTYWSAIGAKNAEATITIKNGDMTSTGNSAGTWNAWDLRFSNCNWNFENVDFLKAVALDNAGKVTNMKNVTITDSHNTDTYALWITAEGQTVTIDGLTIDMLAATDGRGIKIDEQYVDAAAKVTLNVSNATFKTEEKAAILVKSVAGADIALANVDISGVAADTNNVVWVDEKSAGYADLVNVVGGLKIVEP